MLDPHQEQCPACKAVKCGINITDHLMLKVARMQSANCKLRLVSKHGQHFFFPSLSAIHSNRI